MRPHFFIGLHRPQHADQFERCMVSINVLEKRRSDFYPNKWILDSGAFTRIASGKGHMPVDQYAAQIVRWSRCGKMMAAVSQDWMCEPFILSRTGLTVVEHQRRTVEAFAELRKLVPQSIYIMPVLQGYQPAEYVDHIRQYSSLLKPGMWVGVGSVCKRNSNPMSVAAVLIAIKNERPDLMLHGFGLKMTALQSSIVNELLDTCDSMAWSFAARREGRDANAPSEAHRYISAVDSMSIQGHLPGCEWVL